MNPGQDFHQRGLSRAVLADKRQYLSSFQIEIDAFESVNAEETLVDTVHFKRNSCSISVSTPCITDLIVS